MASMLRAQNSGGERLISMSRSPLPASAVVIGCSTAVQISQLRWRLFYFWRPLTQSGKPNYSTKTCYVLQVGAANCTFHCVREQRKNFFCVMQKRARTLSEPVNFPRVSCAKWTLEVTNGLTKRTTVLVRDILINQPHSGPEQWYQWQTQQCRQMCVHPFWWIFGCVHVLQSWIAECLGHFIRWRIRFNRIYVHLFCLCVTNLFETLSV